MKATHKPMDFYTLHKIYNEMVQDYAYECYEFADLVTENHDPLTCVPTIEKDTATFISGSFKISVTYFGRTLNCETVCFIFYEDDIRKDRDIVTRFYDDAGKIEYCHFKA